MKKIIFIVLFIILIATYYYFNINKIHNKPISKQRPFVIEKTLASINKYYIYGTHLNINGSLNLTDTSNITNVSLVLYNVDEINIKTTYTINDEGVSFYLSDYINEGLDLESLSTNNYTLLLKVSTKNINKYYSFNNDTTYKNLTYYSLSKNNYSNQIDLTVDQLFNNKPSFKLNIKNIRTPDFVYDIVLDPGHDGLDSGAVKDNYTEVKLNLNFANKLKDALTKTGYKVKLTRTDNTSKLEPYTPNGRVSMPYITKSKLFLSIHHNSTDKDLNYNGFEVYIPNHLNPSWAKKLATNIETSTSLSLSNKGDYKVFKGVYQRMFTPEDIESYNKELISNNVKPYSNITTDTNYYYTLRETGGMITGAYADNRQSKGENKYRNYNIAAESYLLELGYMSYPDDLLKLTGNIDEYITTITNNINTKYIKNKKDI